jgi:flagellar biosynthesis anti-sigma factor FlgM
VNSETSDRARVGRVLSDASGPVENDQPYDPASTTDRVEVSQDGTFISTAVQAAHDAPAIREDKVARAKKALAGGTLGTDADALADALIDHMLDDEN